MKIAIARAYNGWHKTYKQELNKLGVAAFYFNIENVEWTKIEKQKPDAYLWHADDKGSQSGYLYEKIFFIEQIIKKPVLPDTKMYFAQGNKIKQWRILNYLKVKTPRTYVAENKKLALKIITKLKYPIIIKNPYGFGGYQVLKINSLKEARQQIEKIFQVSATQSPLDWPAIFYAQEFIENDKDLRVITLGDKIYTAYWRSGIKKSWKHNLSQGAEISFKNIPAAALKLCQKISRKLKFHWMAYDLLMKRGKQFLVNEYSCNFGDEGIRQAGLNIRQAQMEYLINYINKTN